MLRRGGKREPMDIAALLADPAAWAALITLIVMEVVPVSYTHLTLPTTERV